MSVNTEKNTTAGEGSPAVEAAALESEAKAERDNSIYTHTFKHPFSYQGVTIEKLTFDWGKLTGEDHLAIENELLLRGKTLVTPEFTGEFLCGMATRACTERNGDGFRILNMEVLKALPMRDFQTICKKARAFLLRAGS